MKELIRLFFIFSRIGLMTIGGGYAMLPIIQREIVEDRHWATNEEVIDWFAIGQCTPGLIAVNTATFVGHKRKGVVGGIVATLGFVTPSIIIIMLIAMLLQNFADYPVVKNAFAGIRVCVMVLIISAIMRMWKSSIVDKVSLGIFLVVALTAAFTSVSPIISILSAAAFGIILKNVQTHLSLKRSCGADAPAEDSDSGKSGGKSDGGAE